MKKLLSVILAVLVASLFILPTCVFAAGDPTIEVSSVSVEAGGGFDVAIVLKDNPGITAMKLKVEFDNDAFKLEKVSYGEDFEGAQPKSLESPVTLNWVKGLENVKGDGEFATLTFTALKSASGKKNVTVTYDPEDVHNTDTKNVAFKVTGGEITVGGGDGAVDSAAVTTVGAEDDKGDYTGPEVDPMTGDETGEGDGGEFKGKAGAETETMDTSAEDSKAPVIWIFAVIAAVLLIAAVVLVIVKKRVAKKPLE